MASGWTWEKDPVFPSFRVWCHCWIWVHVPACMRVCTYYYMRRNAHRFRDCTGWTVRGAKEGVQAVSSEKKEGCKRDAYLTYYYPVGCTYGHTDLGLSKAIQIV